VKDYGPIAVEQYPVLGPAALSLHNWAGRRIPLHATLDGKVLAKGCVRRRSAAQFRISRPKRPAALMLPRPSQSGALD
jgi:DNA-binding IclR family transcriptional regulator